MYNEKAWIQACLDCMTAESEVQHVERYYAVIAKKRIRWLLLKSQPRQYSKVLSNWRPSSTVSRVSMLFLRVFSRFRLLGYSPNIIEIDIKLNGEFIPAACYVGTPSKARKLVGFFVDKCTNKVMGVMKVASFYAARDKIKNEKYILSYLAEHNVSHVPKILNSTLNNLITFQSFCNGKTTDSKLTKAHVDFLLSLQVEPKFLNADIIKNNLLILYQKVKEKQVDIKKRIADAIVNYKFPSKILSVVEHGDFAPWNILLKAGVLRVVDWEDGLIYGLPLQDIFHFHFMVNYLLRKQNLFSISELKKDINILSYVEALEINENAYQTLCKYYLLRAYLLSLIEDDIYRAKYIEALMEFNSI
jgi:hypothetical protein